MLKEALISDYQIFFDLRDKYPKHCELISKIMLYAFKHNDSFEEVTYLNGTFEEDAVRFIFGKLNLHLIVLDVIHSNLRFNSYTIVKLSIED